MKIKSIHGQNFMGQTFEQPIGKLNLFIGPMGSGKSTRAKALTLARDGSVDGNKANQTLFQSFGPADSNIFYVGFTLENGKRIERKYIKKQSGTISEKFQVNGSHNCGKEIFYTAAADAPIIFDVQAFMNMSDKAKVDYVFKRFPPADPAVLKIDQTIASKEKEKNEMMESMRANEKSIQKLTASKKNQNLPAGNLAETQNQIESIRAEIKQAQESIKKIEINMAAKAAAEAEKQKQQFRKATEPEQKSELIKTLSEQSNLKQRMDAAETAMIKKYGFTTTQLYPAVAAIQKIIDTMNAAGCDVCAALLVASAELAKFGKPSNVTNEKDIQF